MMPNQAPNQVPGQEETISKALLPFYQGDTRKSVYLSYRATGFAIEESCQLAEVPLRTLHRWRQTDPNFRAADGEKIAELRKQLANEYIRVEFLRNFRLVLVKDYLILKKSLTPIMELNEQEHQYLLKMRSHYTPQQLAILEGLFQGNHQEEFSFSKLVLHLRQTETKEVVQEVILREADCATA